MIFRGSVDSGEVMGGFSSCFSFDLGLCGAGGVPMDAVEILL